jgi:hypothetical protein
MGEMKKEARRQKEIEGKENRMIFKLERQHIQLL